MQVSVSHVLFLAQRMVVGYGVDVVVYNLARQLEALGHDVTIACVDRDGSYADVRIEPVRPTAASVLELATRIEPSVIVAHTAPFFSMLPALERHHPCWAWEHGDPMPALFDKDSERRSREMHSKRVDCYPRIRGVIAISEFIRRDIGFPAAIVIPNGCDHAPDLGPKAAASLSADGRPLRIGVLMRLGPGEARYKGSAQFLELTHRLRADKLAAEVHVMGRGTPADAAAFERGGFRVHLNAPDAEKWDYLRRLDVFVSCSLWEGFNLPLVEAQALGTVGIALDTGAHPETTPLALSSVEEIRALVHAFGRDRSLLLAHSHRAQAFVRQRFRWSETARLFCERVLEPGDRAHVAGRGA
jgi:glycosyltransferase involved in cell wall biosynthesis